MPAKIVVQSGISAGATHWIPKAVVRVGSDPRAEICIPSANVQQHALTVEFRDGSYRVYNRTPASISVGSLVVLPGKSALWQDTIVLQLNGEIQLLLECDSDPSPVPMRAAEPYAAIDDDEFHADPEPEIDATPTATSSKDNSSFMLQLGVTVLCILGCIGLLARESLKESSADRREPPSFAAVVRNANATTTAAQLVPRLQYAEAAVVRGNRKTAKTRFGRLRDDLIPLRSQFEANERAAELSILDFVEYRLGQLE